MMRMNKLPAVELEESVQRYTLPCTLGNDTQGTNLSPLQ